MNQAQGGVSFITGCHCPSISPPETERYGRGLSVADAVVRSAHCGCECISFPGQIKQSPLSFPCDCILSLRTADVRIR